MTSEIAQAIVFLGATIMIFLMGLTASILTDNNFFLFIWFFILFIDVGDDEE